MAASGAQPRGVVARLRHQVGPLLPSFLRRAGALVVNAFERKRGATYEIAGAQVRFLAGSAPTVIGNKSDDRNVIDALQLARFAEAIAPGDIVADVGSYRGTYTVIAAARAGAHGRVFAFEPTASNAEIVAANVRLNRFTERVTVEQAAVSDRTGTANFFAWGDAQSNSLADQNVEAATVLVRTIALDDYFRSKTFPRVLKIDIEGAELLALRGAQSILASDARIICELHPYAWGPLGYGADELRALLQQYRRYTASLVDGAEVTEYAYGAVWLAKRD